FVALDLPEVASHDDLAATGGNICADLVGTAVGDRTHVHRREHQLGRLGKVEEVRDHLAKGFGLSPNALDVRPVLARQLFELQEPPVAVNCRQAVPELVGDPGGQLAEPGQAVFQPQL